MAQRTLLGGCYTPNVEECYLHNKGDMLICLFVCMLPMAGRTAGPIKTKLGIGTHFDPGSVLVKVKVIYRGPQRQDNRLSAKRDKFGGQRPVSLPWSNTVGLPLES